MAKKRTVYICVVPKRVSVTEGNLHNRDVASLYRNESGAAYWGLCGIHTHTQLRREIRSLIRTATVTHPGVTQHIRFIPYQQAVKIAKSLNATVVSRGLPGYA